MSREPAVGDPRQRKRALLDAFWNRAVGSRSGRSRFLLRQYLDYTVEPSRRVIGAFDADVEVSLARRIPVVQVAVHGDGARRRFA